jgi:diaminohydroxyphosphoribosylaminopyrimidine deaminase/5-amino-6-(5-phosphoribosylamino)uracil reductase
VDAAISPIDAAWMRVALDLARRNTGSTYPNPCVGAVLVKDARLVAAAFSDKTGGPHAEARVLQAAGSDARGSTLYVTLEPCAHHGRTPPCADAIVRAGVARVCVSVGDPAPHVAGKGLAQLRRANIEVVDSCMEEEGRMVHRHYLHHLASGQPFVTLKIGASVDGQIACANGQSKWITGAASRKEAHRLRAIHHAIMVGARTAALDDPALTVRHVNGVDPLVVVLDPRGTLCDERPDAQCLKAGSTLFVSGANFARSQRHWQQKGVECIEMAVDERGHFDLATVLDRLGAATIRSVLVEGGGQLLGSFVRSAMYQELQLFRAPKILGQGRPAFAGLTYETVDACPRLVRKSVQPLGDDLHEVYEMIG